jgi:ADP-ribosylarginine hydrolase
MEDRYIACMVLHAVGDTIGYKNGDWEFNYNKSVEYSYSDILLFEYISLGGIFLNLDGWKVSDDTILHIDTSLILLQENKDVNNFGDLVSEQYVSSMENLKHRHPGITTMEKLELIKNGFKWDKIKYNRYGGGCGGAMRTSCIGLLFSSDQDIDKLIAFSIEASRITNNSVIGYLGGLVSALFTAYAIENKDIETWPFLLLELLSSKKIDNYIKNTRDYEYYIKDKSEFVNYWKKYVEIRFIDKKFNYQKALTIPSNRSMWYIDNFTINKLPPGSLGHDATIIAYDALVEAKDKWETLVVYSMIHMGDSDSTGCIAGSWYGALYGLKNIPISNYKYLEYYNKLLKIGKKIYSKKNI